MSAKYVICALYGNVNNDNNNNNDNDNDNDNNSSQDWMLQLVNRHKKTKKVHSVSCQSKKFKTEVELAPIELNETQPTKRAKIIKREAKRKGLDAMKSKWEQKPLHGQYALQSKDADIDHEIPTNRPDIIVKDCKKKTFLLIDMTVPSDRNLSLNEYEKISKYKDLEIEIQKMWHLKAIVIPVVVGALGMIKKKTEDHIKPIPGDPCLQESQKIALNGKAHLLQRVLSM